MDIDLSAPTSGEESLRGYFGTSLDTVYGGGGHYFDYGEGSLF